MEIEVTGREEQDLLGREEIELEIKHGGEPTPSSGDIRDRISAELDLDPKTVEIMGIYSSSGLSTSRGTVRVHDEPIYDELPEEGEEEAEEPEESGEEVEEEAGGEEEEPEEVEDDNGEEAEGGEEEEPEDTGEEEKEGGS